VTVKLLVIGLKVNGNVSDSAAKMPSFKCPTFEVERIEILSDVSKVP